jgi:serine protease Do
VDGADKIRVRLQDGREFNATVRGTHAEADLAVLRLQGTVTNLAAVRFADSQKVRVGEFAIAVGAPYELDYSVTFGHVSAKGRGNLNGGPLEQDFIQTDAAINFGNSGGPLVNLDGEVIGINAMIRGVGTGLGFAIPANQVRQISDRIIAEGTFRRSWLGIAMPSTFEMQKLKGTQDGPTRGVLVKSIQPDGPASRSKLEAGDIITAVDGKAVASRGQLVSEVALKPPGRDVRLDVLREEKPLQVVVRPESMPESMVAMRPNPHAAPTLPPEPDGAELRKLTPELAKEFSIKGLTAGVLVTEVAEDSLSGAAGLAKGDVITAVNGKPVTTPREYRQALRSSKARRTKVAVLRDGARTVVFIENRSV